MDVPDPSDLALLASQYRPWSVSGTCHHLRCFCCLHQPPLPLHIKGGLKSVSEILCNNFFKVNINSVMMRYITNAHTGGTLHFFGRL